METGNNWLLYLASFSATLVYLTSGTFTGWVSPVLPHLSSSDTRKPLTEAQVSWVVSIMHVGHVLLAIPAGYMVDRVGRKWTLLFTATPFMASWLLTALAENDTLRLNEDGEQRWYVRVELLYAARLVAGLGVGVGSTVGALYLGEIAHDRVRGTIATFVQIMVNLGVMFEYSMAPYISYGTLSLISAVFPFTFLMTFMFMPESPYFLLMHHRRKDAEEALLRLRGVSDPSDVKEELNKIELTVETSRRITGTLRDLVTSKRNQRALLICIGLFSINAFSGHIAILSYSTDIFQKSHSSLDPRMSVIVLGGVQTLLSVVPSFLVDTAGRRPLLLTSSAGCAATLGAEGFYFYFLNDVSGLDWVPLVVIVLYLMFFTLGLGSIPIAVMTEIFPTNVRGLASSFLFIYVAAMHFLVTNLVMAVTVEYYVIFWTFSVCCIFGMFFVIFQVPETKGKSLLDIYLDMGCERDEIKESESLIKCDSPLRLKKMKH